jgi:sortase A
MARQPRSKHISRDQETLDLLQSLIEAPPAATTSKRAPVPLRSVREQQEYALRGFLRRTWVDGALHHIERVLIFVALVVFGMWVVDGPVRDWMHEQEVSAHAGAPLVQPSSRPLPTSLAADGPPMLPFVSPSITDTEQPAEEFLSPRNVPADVPIPPSRQPTRLVIPAIEVDTSVKEVFVVNGVWEVADYAAGYMHGTAFPGDNGNTALAGHAGIRGAVFKDLGRLKPGDDIYLDSGGWRFHYHVREAKNVWPDQVEVLESRGQAELTLITCTNWDTQRLVVVAELLDSAPSPST